MSIFNKVSKTFQWGQHTVTLETGEIARQSSGAVVCRIDDTMVLATVQRVFDERVIDGFVLGVGRTGKALGWLSAWFDRVFVDGLVNGVAATAQSFGSVTRLLQTGRVQQYVAFAVGGTLIAAAWLILS